MIQILDTALKSLKRLVNGLISHYPTVKTVG